MAEVPLTNVFLRPKKGKQEMCHAAVSTESEFFFVKVFNSKLKDKFTPSKIIMISKYYWHSCFLEVMLISLVCDTEFDQISVSKHIIRKDGDTSDYQKFGVGFIFSESRTEDHILCDLNDSTGMIEVLMLGNEEKIQCKEWNKLQLTFLELSKTGEKLYLKSRVHSFINGEGNGTPLQYYRERFAFSLPYPNHIGPHKWYQWTVLPQGMVNSPTMCQYYVAKALEPRNSMLCSITMLAPYTSNGKSHTAKLKKLLVIALLVDSYIFDPLHKVSILTVYNLMNYDKWM
ncbi:PREDICTED: LOW QUALITY PROTEIN: interferon-inducible protein AIM2 [Bison bison bison]|uniref:LOW QUALITY PROTEIN: interferon-inducible protein AIM2 n=1 Tax=Bison bison bison TaxID=43346 RepID=A0A6P3I2Y4_BISBB|nr:PREDICTED: LOW QUALITY PROTEIN: interferon-inducible protein AIM2 [Bison bison bison]